MIRLVALDFSSQGWFFYKAFYTFMYHCTMWSKKSILSLWTSGPNHRIPVERLDPTQAKVEWKLAKKGNSMFVLSTHLLQQSNTWGNLLQQAVCKLRLHLLGWHWHPAGLYDDPLHQKVWLAHHAGFPDMPTRQRETPLPSLTYSFLPNA